MMLRVAMAASPGAVRLVNTSAPSHSVQSFRLDPLQLATNGGSVKEVKGGGYFGSGSKAIWKEYMHS
jgi:hypothetical protein